MQTPETRQDEQPGAETGRFPLAPAQRPFWFAEQASPGTPANNISVRWELRGPIRAADIEAAFRAVIARHEILRTRFVERDGDASQEVLEDAPFRLAQFDIRNLDPDMQETRVSRIESELGAEGFDLSVPCPMRVALVQLAPDRAALLIVVHHAVFDGVSIRVLGAEIGACLAAMAEGEPWHPEPLDLQYGDYALWCAACQDSAAYRDDIAYWRDRLRDAPYFELPPDRPRGTVRRTQGARIARPLAPGFEDRLEGAARRAGVSAYAIGAAATAAALQRLTGDTDILFGTPVAGRPESELERLIGVFINTVVLRLRAEPGTLLSRLVAQAGDTVTSALAHQAMPFDEVLRVSGQRRDPARTPLISITFGLQRVFLQEGRHGPFEMLSVPSQDPGVIYDFDIQILGRNAGWSLVINYNAAVYESATAETLADAVTAALDAIVSGEEHSVAELPVAERHGADPAPLPDAAPADTAAEDLRAEIAPIWAEVLGLPEAACDGDFFDLGGHSVLVLRLLARIDRAFGVRPGVGDFLAAPTLSGFAATVDRLRAAPAGAGAEDDAADAGLWQMLTLRDGPAEGPVVVSLNQPFLYHNVARVFAVEAPVVNLHISAPDALEGPDAPEFDAVIDSAAEQVRAAFPGRPFFLAGQCVDGLMALRLAQTLTAQDDRVAGVAMIDSWAPDADRDLTPAQHRRGRRLAKARRWAHYIGRGLRGEAGLADILSKARAGQRLLRRLGRLEPVTEAERLAREANARLVEAGSNHVFDGYEGEVMLFATESQPRRAEETLFGWQGRVPADTPVFRLEGWHEDALLEHGYRRVAEVIDARLRRLS